MKLKRLLKIIKSGCSGFIKVGGAVALIMGITSAFVFIPPVAIALIIFGTAIIGSVIEGRRMRNKLMEREDSLSLGNDQEGLIVEEDAASKNDKKNSNQLELNASPHLGLDNKTELEMALRQKESFLSPLNATENKDIIAHPAVTSGTAFILHAIDINNFNVDFSHLVSQTQLKEQEKLPQQVLYVTDASLKKLSLLKSLSNKSGVEIIDSAALRAAVAKKMA